MQFSRYIFAQLLRTTCAVTLVIIGIVWLFQTIRLLEMVISRGAAFSDFLLMSFAVIPLWLTIALPIGAFVAVNWVFHRILNDRELTVMQAIGLSPMQIKLQVELPNAVRTTLPSIVSVFIGLWKDTTLLFIIEIVDFFRIAKTMANTDLRFLGDFLEPVYFTAVVFWVFAFYLSRVSMNVEKGLGLVKEGGGDVA